MSILHSMLTDLFRFASITINLGPTFLSGGIAANADDQVTEPSCPLVQVFHHINWTVSSIMSICQGPYRHYVLNLLWILINLLCLSLTVYHLRKLHQDLTCPHIEAARISSLMNSQVYFIFEFIRLCGLNVVKPNFFPAFQEVLSPLMMKGYLNRLEKECISRVKMLSIVTISYLFFWGPLFAVTVWNWDWNWAQAKNSITHEVKSFFPILYCQHIFFSFS